METLHSSPFVDINYDEQKMLFVLNWKPATSSMTINKFKEVMLIYVDMLKKHSAKYVMHQMQNMKFTISESTQSWIDSNVNKVASNNGIKKGAIVVSKDLFTQVSVELSLEDVDTNWSLNIEHFDNEKEALKWLLG